MARGTGACALVKAASRGTAAPSAKTIRDSFESPTLWGTTLTADKDASSAPPHTDRPAGYDRFHRSLVKTSYLTGPLPSFAQTLARLTEIHGSEGAAWVWGYLVEAALDLAAPETVAYPYVRERMRQFSEEYRNYLNGNIAVPPNPLYKPVTDSDAVALRELTEILHAGMTSFGSLVAV
jgi:hypothetical protein